MARPIVTHPDASEAPVKTPTQKLVEDANRIVHVVDDRGRDIGVRRMSMSVRRRVLKAIRPSLSDNDKYLGLIMLSACVVSIDGANVDPFDNGGTEIVFNSLIDRLDDDGFTAVGRAIQELTPGATKEDLKNS